MIQVTPCPLQCFLILKICRGDWDMTFEGKVLMQLQYLTMLNMDKNHCMVYFLIWQKRMEIDMIDVGPLWTVILYFYGYGNGSMESLCKNASCQDFRLWPWNLDPTLKGAPQCLTPVRVLHIHSVTSSCQQHTYRLYMQACAMAVFSHVHAYQIICLSVRSLSLTDHTDK